MAITVSFPIKPFPVPESVVLEVPTSGLRQDGMQPAVHLKLKDLTEETLLELCDQFMKDVFALAKKDIPT